MGGRREVGDFKLCLLHIPLLFIQSCLHLGSAIRYTLYLTCLPRLISKSFSSSPSTGAGHLRLTQAVLQPVLSFLSQHIQGRTGSEVESSCSCRGPRFHLQHPHGRLQPSLTPVPGNLMPSYVFSGTPGTYVHKAHMHEGKTFIHRMNTYIKI